MFEDITLVIPTHNRHQYLERALKYYASYKIKIIVGDSTNHPYTKLPAHVIYHHMPSLSLPEKLRELSKKVRTKFIVLCADDDFIIPESISKCVEFLKMHPEHATVQGRVIAYDKEELQKGKVLFAPLYAENIFEITDVDPFKRIHHFFNPYHNCFYAVHHTKNIKDAFAKNKKDLNLFLNEFLTGVIPLFRGKATELPILYQIREHSKHSDGHKTVNLYDIISTKDYQDLYQQYLIQIADILKEDAALNKEELINKFRTLFSHLAAYLEYLNKKGDSKSLKKRIGEMIALMPFVGKRIVALNRKAEIRNRMNAVVTAEADKNALQEVASFLLDTRNVIL